MVAEITPAQGSHTLEDIDKYLDMVPEHERNKYGGTYVSPDYKLYFFANEEDADAFAENNDMRLVLAGPFPIGGGGGGQQGVVQFRFINTLAGNVFITSGKQHFVQVHVRSLVNYGDGDVPYDYSVNLQLIVNNGGVRNEYDLGAIETNKNVEIDILQGNNRFRIADGSTIQFVATSVDNGKRNTAEAKVVMATMRLSTTNETWWSTAFTGAVSVPVSVEANIDSLLTAKLIDGDGIVRSSVERDSSEFSQNITLVLPHPSTQQGTSGVYRLELKLAPTDSANANLAITLEYQVACVSEGDTANYLIVNNVGSINNYATSRVFDYAVAGVGNPTVVFSARKDGMEIANSGELSAMLGQKYSYNLALQVASSSDFDVDIVANVNKKQVYNATFPVVNKSAYSPTPNADVFIRMDGRSNAEKNPERFTNLMNGAEILPTINGVDFTAADGFLNEMMNDGTQRTFFRMLSGSTMLLPIRPFSMNTAEGRTFEIHYRLNNVLSPEDSIITCKDSSRNGLDVTPETILLMAPSARVEDDQTAGVDSSQEIVLTVVVRPQNGSNVNVDDFSCCFIYINGCINKEFKYDRDLNVNAMLSIGSDASDIDIFAIRTYKSALTRSEVERNVTSLLSTEAERYAFQQRNDVRQNSRVDYAKVSARCNTIIFETNTLPSLKWSKDDKVKARIEFYSKGESEPEYVHDVTDFTWQGTTSHNYGADTDDMNVGQNYKWGSGGRKYCAKANWASSMQSHKIALTAAYTDLAIKCGVLGDNENRRISILQEPAVGFWRKPSGELVFIGIFTVGADKGDKQTFGFGSNSIALENSDNEPIGSNFLCPWNDDSVRVDDSKETYTIMGQKAWEDSMKNATGVTNVWKSAFNFVYECSQKILPYIGTLDALQKDSSVDTEHGTSYWLTSTKKLYYYHLTEKTWKDSGINMMTSLSDYGITSADASLSAEVLNTKFKEARVKKFKTLVSGHFDITDAFYHLAFIEFFGCTDNLTKNTYPYVIDCTAAKPLVKWRQDDLDSSLMTENQGKNYKKYCIEIDDNYSEYGRIPLQVFNGTENQFWLLLRIAFADELKTFIVDKFMTALTSGSGASPESGFAQFCSEYFFDNAQNHFPEALYNETSRIRYEQASINEGYQYAGIALSQNSGNAYLMERYWLRMRYVYMSSKYLVGNFKGGTTNDTFTTRPFKGGSPNVYAITPAIYMYPSVQNGQTAIRGERIYPGSKTKTHVFTLPESQGDQEQRISGMSYIKSVGDMYALSIKDNVDVNGKMLTDLNLGNLSGDNMNIAITGVAVGNASSLRNVVIANIETLGGNNSFTSCVNLREMHAEGTSVTNIALCDGGPLEVLHLPATITSLRLDGKKKLRDLQIDGIDNLVNLSVKNCSREATAYVLGLLNDGIPESLQTFEFTFGTENNPLELSESQIDAIIELIGNNNVSVQLGGYVTSQNGIKGSVAWMLENSGVTYVGQRINDSFSISTDKTSAKEGDAVTINVNGIPMNALNFDVQVSVVSGNVTAEYVKSLCIIVGNVLTIKKGSDTTGWTASITIVATTKFVSSARASRTITAKGRILPTAFSLSGPAEIEVSKSSEAYADYTINYTPSSFEDDVDVNIDIDGEYASYVTVSNKSRDGFRLSVPAGTFGSSVIVKVSVSIEDVSLEESIKVELKKKVIPAPFIISNPTDKPIEFSITQRLSGLTYYIAYVYDYYELEENEKEDYDFDSVTYTPKVTSTPLKSTVPPKGSIFLKQESDTIWKGQFVINDKGLIFEGDIMALLKDRKLGVSAFAQMFYNCSGITIAPKLPATELTQSCYEYMFFGCSSLTTAPELPATVLATSCYSNMFRGCTSLVNAPDLPATVLATSCYSNMFYGCTSLIQAPELPATRLVDFCYSNMFYECSKLNYVKAMFLFKPESAFIINWLKGVASSGTFVKNADATWNDSGNTIVPSGWTVLTATN